MGFDARCGAYLTKAERNQKPEKSMNATDSIGSTFLQRILIQMKDQGVSQTELARRMKVSCPYITKVLHRDVNFSFRTAEKLANALKMDFFPELRPRNERMPLIDMAGQK